MAGEKQSERSEDLDPQPGTGSTDGQGPSGGQQGEAHEEPPLPREPCPLEVWPNLGCLLWMIAVGVLTLAITHDYGSRGNQYYIIFYSAAPVLIFFAAASIATWIRGRSFRSLLSCSVLSILAAAMIFCIFTWGTLKTVPVLLLFVLPAPFAAVGVWVTRPRPQSERSAESRPSRDGSLPAPDDDRRPRQ